MFCISALSPWADINGFKFSKVKIFKSHTTVCLHFFKTRRNHADPVLMVNNIQVPVVTKTLFLGVVFDHKLTFISNIKFLKL